MVRHLFNVNQHVMCLWLNSPRPTISEYSSFACIGKTGKRQFFFSLYHQPSDIICIEKHALDETFKHYYIGCIQSKVTNKVT